MNILYCGDINIYSGLIISILSLLKHNKSELHIYVFTMNYKDDDIKVVAIDQGKIDVLNTLVKQTNPASYVKRYDLSKEIADYLPIANMSTRFTPCCMLRLFADKVPDVSGKLLYLDCDVVAMKDWQPLYDTDITDYEIAGVLDNYGSNFLKTSLTLHKDYLNSGVLLLNMDMIRQTDLLKKCRRRCRYFRMFMPDQSSLNICAHHKLILDRKYNEQKEIKDDTVMRHFTTTLHFWPRLEVRTVKPWDVDRLHNVLNTYEIEDILEDYKRIISGNLPIVPIFYTVDDRYARYAEVSITSLIQNISKGFKYFIYIILKTDLSDENYNRLKALETDEVSIIFKQLDRNLSAIPEKDVLAGDQFNLTIYFRLFIPELFQEYDKCLYIDADTVVNDDISKLYNIDIGDNLFGAVGDLSICLNDDLMKYISEVVGIERGKYVNSGVLVMNLKRLREVNFADHFMYLLEKYTFNTVAPDQDYINSMAKGNIYYLDSTWNCMPASPEDIEKPSLIHYNLTSKPWRYNNIKYQNYFWLYALATSSYTALKQELADFSEEMKERDNAAMAGMVARALEICNDEITFRKAFEELKEERI